MRKARLTLNLSLPLPFYSHHLSLSLSLLLLGFSLPFKLAVVCDVFFLQLKRGWISPRLIRVAWLCEKWKHTQTHTHTRVRTHTRTHTNSHSRTQAHTHTHACAHSRTRVNIHMCMDHYCTQNTYTLKVTRVLKPTYTLRLQDLRQIKHRFTHLLAASTHYFRHRPWTS